MPTVPLPVPTVAFTDERLANGLRLIVAEDHLAPVVAVNVWYNVGSKHEQPGKTGFAHLFEHVMFQGSKHVGQGRAHRPRPGGRRHDERHDLARPHELLRDDAVPPARPRAVARGRPDGDAPRGAQPGEPRQPARGREEREALVVRQPALRHVAGEAPGPPLPAGASVPPLDDRLDGGPRRGLARGRQRVLPDLLRAEQRGHLGRRRRRHRGGQSQRRALLRGHPGRTRTSRRSATCRCRRRWVPRSARPSTTRSRCRASTSGSAPRSTAITAWTRSRSPARSSPAARAAGCTAASSGTSASPRTSRCSRSGSSAAPRSRPAGRRSARA